MKEATSEDGARRRVIAIRIALFGFGFAFLATLIAPLMTPNSNAIADTISDVAAGPYDWIQDAGFYVLAVSLFVLAYAMLHRKGNDYTWIAAAIAFAIMGGTVAAMAWFEAYSSAPKSDDVIHYRLVYAYGGAFIAALLLTLRELARDHSGWWFINIGLAVAWAAGALFFFNMGTSWDGLVERALALAQVAWLYLFAWKVEHEGGGSHLPDRFVPSVVRDNTARA